MSEDLNKLRELASSLVSVQHHAPEEELRLYRELTDEAGPAIIDLIARLQAAEERAEKLEAENAQLKLTVAWAKTFGAAHDMMQDALKAISYHAENQDIGHIDYRMHAKQQADHVLEACAGSPGLLDLAPTPKPDWSDGQWKWADDERAAALKTEGA